MLTEFERLEALKRAAWDARDLDLFEFYNRLEFDLKRLRAVGKVLSRLYDGGFSGDGWTALFEALSDAGLIGESE